MERIPAESQQAKSTQPRQRYGRGREKEKALTMQQKLSLANGMIEELEKQLESERKRAEEELDGMKVCAVVYIVLDVDAVVSFLSVYYIFFKF